MIARHFVIRSGTSGRTAACRGGPMSARRMSPRHVSPGIANRKDRTMKRGRRPMALTIMAVLIGMVFILPAAPVLAASCGGTPATCDHKSPDTTGCSADAITKKTVNILNESGYIVGKVELRWSPSCGTAWSRVTNLIGVRATVLEEVDRNTGGSDLRTDYGVLQGQVAFSHMLYVRYKQAQACGNIEYDYGNCTAYIALP
jgi:hypothetical protein